MALSSGGAGRWGGGPGISGWSSGRLGGSAAGSGSSRLQPSAPRWRLLSVVLGGVRGGLHRCSVSGKFGGLALRLRVVRVMVAVLLSSQVGRWWFLCGGVWARGGRVGGAEVSAVAV
jgi:hypothetical protein